LTASPFYDTLLAIEIIAGNLAPQT